MDKIKYLFLDFDGTVRETIADPTPNNPDDRRPPITVEEIKIIDGIPERLEEWREAGWFIVGVSNQSGVEKGYVTAEMVEEVAAATMDEMGIYFPFYYAPCKKHGTSKQLRLRKPDVGMAWEALNEYGAMDLESSFMVGDYISDEVFAENLGIKYVHFKDFIDGKSFFREKGE